MLEPPQPILRVHALLTNLVSTHTEEDFLHLTGRPDLSLHLTQPVVQALKASTIGHVVHQERPLGVLVELVAHLASATRKNTTLQVFSTITLRQTDAFG